MSDRPLRVLLAVLAVFATIGVARLQRGAPSTGATARFAVTAAEFVARAALEQGRRTEGRHRSLKQRRRRTVSSNLPSGANVQWRHDAMASS